MVPPPYINFRENEAEKVYGRPREVQQLMISDNLNKRLRIIKEKSEILQIKTSIMSRNELDRVLPPQARNEHQGVILSCSPIILPLITHLSPIQSSHNTTKPPLFLALDEIHDPHNFGAIIRSAAFFGANGIIIASKNQASPTPAVSKASTGALETFTNLFKVKNLSQFLYHSNNIGGWRVIGASSSPVKRTKPIIECKKLELSEPTILVLGNEGKGLSSGVEDVCSTFVSINKQTRSQDNTSLSHQIEEDETFGIDSLNVSTATSVLLYQLTQ
eukprot:TRINITY_DN5184_c0_g1_i1.p1 TRINITY_DN5184_c0_g1~~TRINITY_DN5184_c0_g1_i1.p1  ORF type:complete len:303 (-),score=48.10 TRINITY_DN5184_c0_g1_i1:55-876(-)